MENLNTHTKIIPESRRTKDNSTIGTLGEDGYFRTPNGSFWDPDGEYFNRHGYDIHGGSYSNIYDYVPGPDWLSELGCYPDERHKYEKGDNDDMDDMDDIGDMDDLDQNEPAEMKGDFEDESDDIGISLEDLTKLNIKPNSKDAKALLAKYGLMPETKKKKKNKKRNKEEDEWESFDEEENL